MRAFLNGLTNGSPLPTDRTCSPRELAEYLGISHDKVLNWIRNGRLRAINVASPTSIRPRYRIEPAAIDELRTRDTHKPMPPVRRRRWQRPNDDVIEFF